MGGVRPRSDRATGIFARFAPHHWPSPPAVVPAVSPHFDYEGELAVVIGKAGRRIPVARALDHVAAYAGFNQGSLRDCQRHTVTAGKSFPRTGPLGPWLVTTDEIPDPAG